MKKGILAALAAVLIFSQALRANAFLTLGYDYSFTGANSLLSVDNARTSYMNGDAGWVFDCGVSASFKYDHISMEDFSYNSENAKAVAVIPAIGLGWETKFWEDRLMFWANAYAGYAVSVRYRLGVTDHKAGGFSPSFSAGLYYNVKGQFFAGVEAGYRMLKVSYGDLAGEPALDLSGPFGGISFKHVFSE
jgi:hypothetical protein